MADMIQEADELWADFLEIYLSERETDPSDIPDLDTPDLPTQKYLQIFRGSTPGIRENVCVWLHLFVRLMLISSMKARRLTTWPKSKTNIYCRCRLEFAFRNGPCMISRNRFNDAD
jgi:hypothetical protein